MEPQLQPGTAKSSAAERDFLGHPTGLYVLFLAQMWERFSYFGMLALLILYLNEYFKLSQSDASSIFKWYTSAIYFTPLFGAFLADRFLGNKLTVLLGAGLMALGHFLMAFPSLAVLYSALLLLVVGCGLLTPPLTTQVGLLYAPNDPRRDSAYTIFYMGINLGAFISPLACGWLAENTRGPYHSGFTLAGLGMVVALLTYLVGLRWVRELDQGSTTQTHAGAEPSSQQAVEQLPSAAPLLNRIAPRVLLVLGILLACAAPLGVWADQISWDTFLMLELGALALLIFGWIAASVVGGVRDRVLAILVLAVFAIFYCAGMGQYGNAFNLWAEQNTNRYLSEAATAPSLFPDAAPEGAAQEADATDFWDRWIVLFERLPKKNPDADKSWADWWSSMWNPVPAPWFQSVNPLLILLLAPVFAWLWPWLNRRGVNPSIPTKMGLGLLLMTLAFALMWGAASREAQETRLVFAADLPKTLVLNSQGQVCRAHKDKDPEPYNAGRLFFDSGRREFRVIGVFTDLVRDEIVGDTSSEDFAKRLEELKKKFDEAPSGARKAQVQLDTEPPGFDLRYAGFGKKTGNQDVSYDGATRTLTTTIPLEEKEIKRLKVAAGDPQLRTALDDLMVRSNTHCVSVWWLIGFYLLATMGELCLSPVGMSMVSQLAPRRFATMLMGLWLLIFAFGNFAAGAFGEKWGTWTPISYFLVVMATIGAATVVFFLLSRKTANMMHETP